MQNKAILYANLIIGDFEPVSTVQRSLDSVSPYVDGLYITLTYTDTEPTEEHPLVQLLKKYNTHISFFKWEKNFATARQFAMDQVPKSKTTYLYWQDADDVLVNGEKLHQLADEMIINKQSGIFLDYWYQVELDEQGNVKEILVKHKRERIILHDDTWQWVGDLHETLINQRQENIIRHYRPECHIVHLTDHDRLDRNIDRNIEILEASAKSQNHKDPRTLIYLAKAYFDKAKMAPDEKARKIPMDLALNLFNEYLNGSGKIGEEGYREPSGWKEERSTAWAYIAEIAILSQHPEAAIGAYQNAIDEAPQFPNYYIDMAMCYIMLEDFEKAKHWLFVGTQLPEPQTTIIQFPRELKSRALETAFHIHMHYNKIEKALDIAQQLVKLFPNDTFAKQRLDTVTQLWEYNKAAQSLVFLGKYLEQRKENKQLQHLIKAIPNGMENEKFAAEMKHLFTAAKKWKDNEIAILCGPGWEKWSPDSMKTGLGGSEEAVVQLSNELTKKGWKVTVYANPEVPKTYSGVEYKMWHDINPRDEFNVVILWRAIGFVDIEPKAKFTLLWLHDVPNNPDFTEARVNKVDKIAVLSEYHKSLLRMQKDDGTFVKIPDNKIFLTSNGIGEMTNTWDGKPTKMIYSSSIDRGLPYLLKEWSRIKAEVPDAELNIYYGFEIYDKIHGNNPARMQWKNQVLQLMKQSGIIYHGRVGHEKLHEEMSKCGLWVYPTDFQEISCITAMKAQALGAVPVVTNYAALEETVKNGLRVDVDIRTEEGQTEYADTLIAILKDPAKQEEIRKQMMSWAREYYSWVNVAKIWDQLFRVNLQNPERKYETKRNIIKQSSEDENNQGRTDGTTLGSNSGEEQERDITDSIGDNAGDRKNKKTPQNSPRRGRKESGKHTDSLITPTTKGDEV